MNEKRSYKREELEQYYSESPYEHYNILMRFLARTIHGYLKANPKILKKKNNIAIYKKALRKRIKGSLANTTDKEYYDIIDLFEFFCDTDIQSEENEYDSTSVLQSIMDYFFNI